MNFCSPTLLSFVNMILTGGLILLAVLVVLCLIRAVVGPRIADRVVAINMMSTMVIVMIAILAVKMGEGYLVDICIIYAAISFLAVIVLTKVYTGVYVEAKEKEMLKAEEAKEKEMMKAEEAAKVSTAEQLQEQPQKQLKEQSLETGETEV